MSSEAAVLTMSHADYSAFEREARTKHEYLAGEVYAMSGGSLEHGRLAAELGRVIGNALQGSDCRVLSSDARVRIEAADVDVYPDLSVVCGVPLTANTDDHALINPRLVVEVLSPSTEAYDRGLKASNYRKLESLRAYLLVAQDRRRLELQLRGADGRWVIVEAGPRERLLIEPIGVEIDVDRLYREALTG